MTLSIMLSQLLLSTTAVAIQVAGDVQFESKGTVAPVVRFAEVPQGATVRTGPDGRVALRLPSGSLVRLGPQTHIALTSIERGIPAAKRKETVRVVVGRMWAHVMGLLGTESRFEVATSNAVAGVRGTSFWVSSTEGGAGEFVLEHGALDIRQGDVNLMLDRPGSAASFRAGGLAAGGTLDAWALATLRRGVGGAGASMISSLGGQRGALLQRGLRREEMRRTLVGPDNTIDSPVTSPRVGHELRGLAEIRVRLQLPDQP